MNSTFYRIPTIETTRSWVERTPSGFEFSVKLFQKLTHPRMFLDRLTKPPKGAPKDMVAEKSTLPHDQALAAAGVSSADVDEFRRAIDPLASAGKLGAILVQFPASFKHDAAGVDHLAWLTKALRDYQVAVELRHKTWSDDVKTTLQVLNASRAAWVQIDEPKFRLSIAQNFLPNVEGFYYLRLHGRNAKAWWNHEKSADRYDYLYSAQELDPFVEIAQAVKVLVKKMYLYTNNHFEGKAAANAVMLRDKLGLPNPGGYPPAFVEHYPALAGIVETTTPTAQGRACCERARRSAQARSHGVTFGATACPCSRACSTRSRPIDTRHLFRPVSSGLVTLLRALPAGTGTGRPSRAPGSCATSSPICSTRRCAGSPSIATA